MVFNLPWKLPFLGAKRLASPEKMAIGVNTPGSDENSMKQLGFDVNFVKCCCSSVADKISSVAEKKLSGADTDQRTAYYRESQVLQFTKFPRQSFQQSLKMKVFKET
ncbi:hypothetical protein Tco_0541126 [Tanacetum coccineum]